jgi:flagellar protein FlgJ
MSTNALNTAMHPTGADTLIKPAKTQAQLHKAAEDFAAVAIGELLSPMFETVDTSDNPMDGGEGEKAWKPMMITEIAKQIARGDALGLTEPVYQQMLRMQERK